MRPEPDPARQTAPKPEAAEPPRSAAPQTSGALPDCMLTGTPAHDARALTGGGSVAHVMLGGQVYVLRITRAGKLILTK